MLPTVCARGGGRRRRLWPRRGGAHQPPWKRRLFLAAARAAARRRHARARRQPAGQHRGHAAHRLRAWWRAAASSEASPRRCTSAALETPPFPRRRPRCCSPPTRPRSSPARRASTRPSRPTSARLVAGGDRGLAAGVYISFPGNAAFFSRWSPPPSTRSSPARRVAPSVCCAPLRSRRLAALAVVSSLRRRCTAFCREVAPFFPTPPALAYFTIAVVALHPHGGVLELPSVAIGCDGACACSLPPPSMRCRRLKDWWRFQG